MRHLKAGRKLGRNSSHRKAMYRNMAEALIDKGRIETTLMKAKELRSFAEKLITLGKRNTLAARRQAREMIRSKGSLNKLFNDLAPSFKDRQGGYTRIIRLGDRRRGDNAEMAFIEYLGVTIPLRGKKAKAKAEADAKKSKDKPKKLKKSSEKGEVVEAASKEKKAAKKTTKKTTGKTATKKTAKTTKKKAKKASKK